MDSTKLKRGLTVLAIAGAAIMLVTQHRIQAKLREENRSLRQQIAQLQAGNGGPSHRGLRARSTPTPRLPAPPMKAAASPAGPIEDVQSTNSLARLRETMVKLTAAQVESYLKANRRDAASLLAAFRATGDQALLQEAMQKYPHDPQVDFEAVFTKNASPEERRQWLDAFEQAAPENALANYLSALDYFKAGQTDQAVQELIAASGKPQFQDYRLEAAQDDEEAYLAAGYSVAEAKMLAVAQLPLPQFQPLREMARDYLIPLADSYQQVGDGTSEQAALQMALNLAQRLEDPPGDYTLLSQLVGMAIERQAFSTMDPNNPCGDNGQTIQDRLSQITQQKAALQDLGQQFGALTQTMSDQDWISYRDRQMMFGQEAAMQWVVSKYGHN